jgi:hypothetical protein
MQEKYIYESQFLSSQSVPEKKEQGCNLHSSLASWMASNEAERQTTELKHIKPTRRSDNLVPLEASVSKGGSTVSLRCSGYITKDNA